jgi:branched-chain amino acid transport system permease protein
MFSGYTESIAIFLGINILMAFSVYLPEAAGLISLGQGGFMAIGAYASAVLTTNAGVPFLPALLAGGALAALVGALVAAPALRIRGIYLIILTLGFGEIVRVFFLNFAPTGGASGFINIPPLTTLPAVAAACALTLWVVWRLRSTGLGRAMVAVREDEAAAAAMGVNLMRLKLGTFAAGAFIAGIAGAFYAHYAVFIDPSQFDFTRSADAFLYVILGGSRSPLGPIVGAALVTVLPELLRFLSDWRMTLFGVLLVVAAIWRPAGLLRPLRPR